MLADCRPIGLQRVGQSKGVASSSSIIIKSVTSPSDVKYRGQTQAPKALDSQVGLGRRLRGARRVVVGWLLRCGYWVLPKLPLWSLSMIVRMTAVPLSRRMYWRRSEQNLIKVYGERLTADERKKVLTEVFNSLGAMLLECVGVITKGLDSYLARVDDTDARARIEALERESPRGWIGVSGHIGNWILLGSWASSLPGRGLCQAIAKRQPNPHLNAILEDGLARLQLQPVYSDGPPVELVAKMLRELRTGTRLGIAPDQDTPRVPGVFIDFLGHRAYTPSGPAQLALAANVPLLPIVLVRAGKGFKIIAGDPIHPDRTRPRQEELVRLTEAWSQWLEEVIHEHKGQWFWFHRRWRTTPEKLAARGPRAAVGLSRQLGSAEARGRKKRSRSP